MDKKFKIFVVVGLVVVLLLASAAVFLVLQSNKAPDTTTEQSGEPAKEDLTILYMDEALNANLKLGANKIPHIMRVAIGVQVDMTHEDFETFTADFAGNQIVVRDSIIQILKTKTYDDMMTETAQSELADAIKESVNTLLDTDIVYDVYFKEFFVQ